MTNYEKKTTNDIRYHVAIRYMHCITISMRTKARRGTVEY